MASNKVKGQFAQGDLLFIRKGDVPGDTKAPPADLTRPIILQEGEVTGHTHSLYGSATMFREDGAGSGAAGSLYITSLNVGPKGAAVKHEEHKTVDLAAGNWEVRRQRQQFGQREELVSD